MITINRKSRSYLLSSVPTNATTPLPLIIAFHGRTNNNTMVRNYMGLEGREYNRDRNSFTPTTKAIVAYPAGIPVSGGYSWSEFESIIFFDAIITEISDAYCVDRSKIYIVGHSL
jgi:poly(3-hydroxybutyrate) depolymerase